MLRTPMRAIMEGMKAGISREGNEDPATRVFRPENRAGEWRVFSVGGLMESRSNLLGGLALGAERAKAQCIVAFGEAFAFIIGHEGTMVKCRWSGVERLVKE